MNRHFFHYHIADLAETFKTCGTNQDTKKVKFNNSRGPVCHSSTPDFGTGISNQLKHTVKVKVCPRYLNMNRFYPALSRQGVKTVQFAAITFAAI